MQQQRNLTVIHVIVGCVAILIGLLYLLSPVLMTSCGGMPPQVRNMAQVRWIVQALHMQAVERGDLSEAYPGSTLERFAALIQNGAIEPRILVNPASDEVRYEIDSSRGEAVKLTAKNVSYALIHATSDPWTDLRANESPRTPLVADRKRGQGSTWNADSWVGAIGWADGSAGHERTPVHTVRFGGSTFTEFNIFTSTEANRDGVINQLRNP
ncbi:MAG: hypothetical protein JJU36_17800 [Phycisphaeraceae bacterium]|nr:hypothetical protein [Phycisphaeraceae bacterium]